MRAYPPRYVFKLAAGENKTIDLRKERMLPEPPAPGAAIIRVYLPNGVHTNAHISLSGPNGLVTPQTRQRGRIGFVAPPGEYEATISLKGFTTQKKTIALVPTQNGRPIVSWETNIFLQEQ